MNTTLTRPLASVRALSGLGIAADRHAGAHSPRQVLIAGDEAYQRFGLADGVLGESLRVAGRTDDWRAGELLQVGDEVLLWLTFACEPCGRLDRHRPGLSAVIGRHRGMLARVLRGGTMHPGDRVLPVGSALPADADLFSDDWRARVLAVARAVPPGRWIRYAQLAGMAGVAMTYCRAFPRVLAGLPAEVGERVRTAAQATSGQPWDGAGLFEAKVDVDVDVDPDAALAAAPPQRPGVEKR
ncbi:MOSC domain-containing protein [Sphaerotilus mobilis]|uniref:MOSC domain-containing protein n=1 Tax=Sphaerotilus mobilis TaxID=47994 RepID=A0A4V2EW69_9BURK|nr:MOSC domain-containing protein [Sphaerotilus mobilis]RZS54950.1 hypothetical protein EV685_2436 [Sphaerotilus mobilis]